MSGDLYRNSRALKQVRTLAENGWSVHVLALQGGTQPVDLPSGVRLDQIPLDRSGGFRFFRELNRKMSQSALEIDAVCYHASDLYVLPALADAARAHNKVYTYDSRELYPHVAATVGRPWVRWYWGYVEEKYIRGAAVVFTVSKAIADHLEKEYRIRRPVLVRNLPPKAHPEPSGKLAALANLDSTTPIILHLGQMRRARGCETLVQAMAYVNGAHLIFLGYGSERAHLQALTSELKLGDRISFIDAVPADEVLGHTADAAVGVTLLEDTCLNHRYALPNKLFEYLMAGVPVLASHLPEVRAVVQGYNVGRTVNPANPQAVADALNEMLSPAADRAAWVRNAERLCETFNWEKASQRFERAFRSILMRPSSDSVLDRQDIDQHPAS